MIKKILLPLDGSDAAEEVIPYGEELAKKLGCEVILFHTCVPEYRLACNMHRLYLVKTAELMQERLEKDSTKGEVPKVKAEFLRGDFAISLTDYVAAKDVDLVIMAAYGFTSIRIRNTGSVASKIFRLLQCPSLLIRSGDSERRGKNKLMSRILVPMDGTKGGEAALPLVSELTLKLKAKVNLFSMTLKSYLAAEVEDEKANTASQRRITSYLTSIESEFSKQGIKASSTTGLGDDVAAAIIEAVKVVNADMVVMATRGRSPSHVWAPGSIAHKMLNTGDLPLLIVNKVENS
jgi:nucleotide-binding universal stress UspA family protein